MNISTNYFITFRMNTITLMFTFTLSSLIYIFNILTIMLFSIRIQRDNNELQDL